ncbi:ER membrane protein complex subunit 5 [Schistocerca americana]|uniref:ER membrane protein complex subunit 5 n=1 Tax=Schistocerca americana TaxID=7009 RepID=UPI001F4F8C32|nr:ER membrane protein complex subunit 5 [Schistocerca americana]XP_047107310.1 ER membrane protein complex subunit 5 [Schistocerca piceifrons]XP_049773233.1 ER membrane protein complex subunit 5 [Schistocerca cancellata]XP_049799472.1 ER membrane protein complex subunit 5 [Schistocerca nitens]XP_049856279.1 ER membrane protein complex subunit 5 [Schistocerca gregaria]XP_049948689.1 ER membrane protein complex subunit 5 [Schistocerca serialis cubense]
MASLTHKLILSFGLLSLLHAAYSAAQHRSYLRITEQEFVTLPFDIMIQGIVSLFVTLYGVLHIAGDFKEIRATVDLENKSWETLRNIPSFYVFSHRGKALSPNYVPPIQKSALEEPQS